jgi:RNA polymerase-binding transcription factor DksA
MCAPVGDLPQGTAILLPRVVAAIGTERQQEGTKMTPGREHVEDDLQRAEAELQQLDDRLRDRPNFGPGKGSVGGYSWQMALARRKTVVSRIKALQGALIALDKGTYGLCTRCGGEIDPERLEILPGTALCAECARTRETRSTMGWRARNPALSW